MLLMGLMFDPVFGPNHASKTKDGTSVDDLYDKIIEYLLKQ